MRAPAVAAMVTLSIGAAYVGMSGHGQSLQVLCHAERLPGTKSALTRKPTWRRSRFIRLPRPTEWAFIHRGARPERQRTKGY